MERLRVNQHAGQPAPHKSHSECVVRPLDRMDISSLYKKICENFYEEGAKFV